MNLAGLLNKIFGISNKQVDYFATIFAAVLLSSGNKYNEKMQKQIEDDAKKLFKSKTTGGLFASEVEFLIKGGANKVQDLNALVKMINKNSKMYKRWNPRIPYHLLNKYIIKKDIQTRVFEFLYTIRTDNSRLRT